MKIRRGFVTNSSSSSFVVARKDGCTVQEIRDELELHKNDIYIDMDDCEGYYGSFSKFLDEFAQWLFDRADDIKLDNWSVCAIECSNEGDDFDAATYDMGGIATEHFRLSSCW